MKSHAFIIGAVLLLASPALAVYGVGDQVADFTLNDSTGTPHALYDYQGMAMFIHFWGDC